MVRAGKEQVRSDPDKVPAGVHLRGSGAVRAVRCGTKSGKWAAAESGGSSEARVGAGSESTPWVFC